MSSTAPAASIYTTTPNASEWTSTYSDGITLSSNSFIFPPSSSDVTYSVTVSLALNISWSPFTSPGNFEIDVFASPEPTQYIYYNANITTSPYTVTLSFTTTFVVKASGSTTTVVIDSYSIAGGPSSWSAPGTMDISSPSIVNVGVVG